MNPTLATGELQAFKAPFFKALAQPTRFRIVECLVERDRSVQELQAVLTRTVRDPLVRDLLDVARRITRRNAGHAPRTAARALSALTCCSSPRS